MSEDQLGVKIVADASGVKPGTDKTKAEISSIAPLLMQLNTTMQEMAAGMAAGFQQIAAGIGSAKTQVRELHEEATVGFGGMIAKIHEGAESVRTFQMRAKEFAEVYVSMFAVERVAEWTKSLGEAGERIEHLASTFGMSVEQVQQLQVVSLSTGVSLETITRGMGLLDKNAATSSKSSNAVGKALQFVGISANDGMTQMQRLMVVADKFKGLEGGTNKVALAYALLGRSGKELIPVLNKGAEGLQELISKGEQYGAVNKEAAAKEAALAETVNESKIAWLGLQNTFADALAPAMLQVTQGLNDLSKSLVESYNNGGAVHQMFDGLKTIGGDLWGVLSGLAPVFTAIATNAHAATIALEALIAVMAAKYAAGVATAIAGSRAVTAVLFAIEAAAGGAATAMEAFTLVAATAGRTLLAALGGPIGVALIAITAGLYELYTITDKATEATARFKSIQDGARDSAQQTKTAIDDLANAHGKAREEAEKEAKAHLDNANAKLKDAEASAALAQAELQRANASYQAEESAAKAAPAVGVGSGGIPGFGFSPAAAASAAAVDQAKANLAAARGAVTSLKQQIGDLQKALSAPPPAAPATVDLSNGKQKDTLVERLEEKLTREKLAWDQAQDQQNTAQQFSLESEKAFWAKALETQGGSAKDREEIERKYLAASQALRNEQIKGQLETFRQEEEAAGKSADAKLAVVKEEVAYIGRIYGTQSDQYKAILAKEIDAERRAAEEKEAIAKQTADSLRRLDQLRVAGAAQDEQFLAEMRLKTQLEMLATDRDTENRRYQQESQALQQRLALMKDPSRDPVAYAALNGQIEQLEQAHQNTLNKIAQKAVLERTKYERQAIDQLASSWGSAFGKLLTLQQGFAVTLKSLFQGVQQAVGNALGQIITDWLTQHLSALLIGGAASKAAGAAQISTAAAIAGANGIASFAMAPWPIDMGAPAFGASMAAAATAFQGMLAVPGFDVGAWNLSQDQLAVVHAGETIIPAAEAGGWRNVMSLFGSIGNWTVPEGLRASYGQQALLGAAGGFTAAGGSPFQGAGLGGDAHSHSHYEYHDHTGTMTPQQLMANRGALAKALKQAHKEGAFAGSALRPA